MLTSRQLSVAYGDKSVLQDINLSLKPGEILGLIGPNGAGKTSLIRALSAVIRPSGGQVLINETDLADLPEAQRARQIAVVPQASDLPPAFSVLQCVALGRTPHLNWLGRLSLSDEAKVQEALQAAEIEALADRLTGELSGGEKRRVLLARALAQDCPILLLDEPTAHLDLHHQVGLLELLRRMVAERQLAVLIAMHDLNLASVYTDRLVLLVNGRIQAQGAPASVLTQETLQSAYQVPLQVRANPKHGSPWVVLDRN